MSTRLLPINQTIHETGVAEVTGRISLLDEIIIKLLWEVESCPVAYLDYIAVQFGVEGWKLATTESQKRALLRNCLEIKRHKGTKWAVNKALAAVGLEGLLSEWFEYEGNPYTFRIVVESQEKHLNKQEFEILFALIRAYKNTRSWMEYIRFIRQYLMSTRVAILDHRGHIRTTYTVWLEKTWSRLAVNTAIHLGSALKRTITLNPQDAAELL